MVSRSAYLSLLFLLAVPSTIKPVLEIRCYKDSAQKEQNGIAHILFDEHAGNQSIIEKETAAFIKGAKTHKAFCIIEDALELCSVAQEDEKLEFYGKQLPAITSYIEQEKEALALPTKIFPQLWAQWPRFEHSTPLTGLTKQCRDNGVPVFNAECRHILCLAQKKTISINSAIDHAAYLSHYLYNQCTIIRAEHAPLKKYLLSELAHVKNQLSFAALTLDECTSIFHQLLDIHIVLAFYEHTIIKSETVIIYVGGNHARYLCNAIEEHLAFERIPTDHSQDRMTAISKNPEWIANNEAVNHFMKLVLSGTDTEKATCRKLFTYFDSVWRKNRADIANYFQICPIAV